MLAVIDHVSNASSDSIEPAAYSQPSAISSVAAVYDEARVERATRSVAQVDRFQSKTELFGVCALPSVVFRENISGLQTKLKDFTAEIELSTIGALIVRLNNNYRKIAREDLWAALGADVAAQESAATAIRQSGLCQLFGAILTSSGAMVGAGMGIKGARQSQARFDERFSTNIQRTASSSDPQYEVGDVQVRQAPGADSLELGEAQTAAQVRQAPGADSLELGEAQTAAQREQMRYAGVSQIVTEAAKLLGALPSTAATQFQEEKARRDADSSKAKTWMEDARGFIGYYQTVLQDVLSKLDEIRNADRDTTSKLVSMS